MESPEDERVVVASFSQEFEAQLACQMLLAEGLTPNLNGGRFLGLGDIAIEARSSFEITVPGVQESAAQRLISSAAREHRPEIPESISAEEAIRPCPACGGTDKAYEAKSMRNRHAPGWPFAEPYTWRCAECGHVW